MAAWAHEDQATASYGDGLVASARPTVQELPASFDTDSLMDYLRKLGLDDELIDDLQDALEEDAEEDDDGDKPQGPGRRALTWLKNVSTAATTQVGTPVATTLITQALLHHFGL